MTRVPIVAVAMAALLLLLPAVRTACDATCLVSAVASAPVTTERCPSHGSTAPDRARPKGGGHDHVDADPQNTRTATAVARADLATPHTTAVLPRLTATLLDRALVKPV